MGLSGLLLLTLIANGVSKEEKDSINKEKLIGGWKMVKTDSKSLPRGSKIYFKFDKDGTVTVYTDIPGRDSSRATRPYSVKGNQLTITRKGALGREVKDTWTVKELTDKKMVTVNKQGDMTITTEYEKTK
jgi:uncharacterized protein (TIGR03066 family)